MKNSINSHRAGLLAVGLCLGAQLCPKPAFGQSNCGEYSTDGWSTYNGANFSFNYPPDFTITQDTPTQVTLGKGDMVFEVIYKTDFKTNVSNVLSSAAASVQQTAASDGYMVSIDLPVQDANGALATYVHLTGPNAVDIWIEAQPAPSAVFLTYLQGTPDEVFCNLPAVGWPVSRSVHSLAALSVVGNWTASVPGIRSEGGVSVPGEQYTVSLTFTSDKTYTYNVDQVAQPTWQLRANGFYTTAPAPQNNDDYPLTLQLQPQSVSSSGISNMSLEMLLLSESGLPTDVGGSFLVNIDKDGSLELLKAGIPPVRFTKVTLSQGGGPTITNLSQTTVSAGSAALSLTLTGSGFASGGIVFANQTALPTIFVSANQLTATVGANLLVSAGTLSITVSSSGQVSNAQTITVAPLVSSNLPRVGVLAQMAAGGGWDTEVYLTNSTSGTLSVALSFFADDGTALILPLTAVQQGHTQNVTTSTLTAAIPANTTLAIDTGARSGNVVQGWADVHSDGPLTGFAVFRLAPQGLNSGPGITTPWEGTVPLQTILTASTVVVPFDNTNGFATGLALGNLSTSGTDFNATFFDDNGNPLGSAQTITLSGNGHTAFRVDSMFDFTANVKGLMKITGPGVMALGLRFSPYGTLTSIPVPVQ
jgi:hypothetical protein